MGSWRWRPTAQTPAAAAADAGVGEFVERSPASITRHTAFVQTPHEQPAPPPPKHIPQPPTTRLPLHDAPTSTQANPCCCSTPPPAYTVHTQVVNVLGFKLPFYKSATLLLSLGLSLRVLYYLFKQRPHVIHVSTPGIMCFAAGVHRLGGRVGVGWGGTGEGAPGGEEGGRGGISSAHQALQQVCLHRLARREGDGRGDDVSTPSLMCRL